MLSLERDLWTMGESGDTIREDWSATQREIWEREETYWELSLAADVEGFLELLDERFIGWPGGAELPVAFADFRPYVNDWFESVSEAEFSYSLTPHAIVVAGTVAVSHYHARSSYRYDEEEETRESRITHTWVIEDGTWKIVSGMGCRQPRT
jgi:ketosteroid isomerase-like protein